MPRNTKIEEAPQVTESMPIASSNLDAAIPHEHNGAAPSGWIVPDETISPLRPLEVAIRGHGIVLTLTFRQLGTDEHPVIFDLHREARALAVAPLLDGIASEVKASKTTELYAH